MNSTAKKLISTALVCTVSLSLLAGCSSKKEPESGLANPMTEVAENELEIPLTAPDNSTDVEFYTIDFEGDIINQMDFTQDGVTYTYRAQFTESLQAEDISGMYYDNWETSNAKVDYCDAVVMTNDEVSVVYWLDVVPGVNYSLSSDKAVSAEDIVAIANELFVPLQGEVG